MKETSLNEARAKMGGDFLKNAKEPVVNVFHSELQRYSDDSVYKSTCPFCKDGLLLVGRDQATFQLSEYDHCVVCAQTVRYMDIRELRGGEEPK